MHYPMPNYPCEFEIPDAWLNEAGMDGFTRSAPAYRSTTAAVPVPLREIEPPYRTPEKDWAASTRARLISVLKGIVTGAEMEPVPLLKLPPGDFPAARYRYRVRNGFHRFYASIAAVQPVHVATWIEAGMRELSAPSVKQRLAAIRQLFDWLVTSQVVPVNPAASVRGPRTS